MENDEELEEMLHMEREFENACELYRQYEANVILARLKFQENCPHKEMFTKSTTIGGSYLDRREYITYYYCKRCNKLIDKKVEYGGFD